MSYLALYILKYNGVWGVCLNPRKCIVYIICIFHMTLTLANIVFFYFILKLGYVLLKLGYVLPKFPPYPQPLRIVLRLPPPPYFYFCFTPGVFLD